MANCLASQQVFAFALTPLTERGRIKIDNRTNEPELG
jgi:hypothetical protein